MKTIVINVLFHLLTDSCTYSDWFTISDCSATCGIGYKREVRSFTKVKSELAVAKHCNEDLERLTSCKLDPCKFKFLGVWKQISPLVSVFVWLFFKIAKFILYRSSVKNIEDRVFPYNPCCILSFVTISMYLIVYCKGWIRKHAPNTLLLFFLYSTKTCLLTILL